MACISGHEEEDHRDGSECQVEGCLCACYEPEMEWEHDHDWLPEPKEET